MGASIGLVNRTLSLLGLHTGISEGDYVSWCDLGIRSGARGAGRVPRGRRVFPARVTSSPYWNRPESRMVRRDGRLAMIPIADTRIGTEMTRLINLYFPQLHGTIQFPECLPPHIRAHGRELSQGRAPMAPASFTSCLRTLSRVPTPHEKAPGIASDRMGPGTCRHGTEAGGTQYPRKHGRAFDGRVELAAILCWRVPSGPQPSGDIRTPCLTLLGDIA